MSASNEWTEWHLTPRGWERGTEKTDFSRLDRCPPADRVLSIIYEQFMGHKYSLGTSGVSERWRSADAEAISALEQQFGPAPNEL